MVTYKAHKKYKNYFEINRLIIIEREHKVNLGNMGLYYFVDVFEGECWICDKNKIVYDIFSFYSNVMDYSKLVVCWNCFRKIYTNRYIEKNEKY